MLNHFIVLNATQVTNKLKQFIVVNYLAITELTKQGRSESSYGYFRCIELCVVFSEPCGQTCGESVEEGMTIPHTEVWRARPQDISKISKLSTVIPHSGMPAGLSRLLAINCVVVPIDNPHHGFMIANCDLTLSKKAPL